MRNPLHCAGGRLPAPLALLAKIIALALLLTSVGPFLNRGLGLMPEPFLPFLPVLDRIPADVFRPALLAGTLLGAIGVLAARDTRRFSLLLGLVLLLSVLSSRASYANNRLMCACLLILTGLYDERWGPWLIRAQIALAYLGAGMNKLLDPDWQSGLFIHHWSAVRLQQPVYLWLTPALPPLALGKLIAWGTIATELGLAAALLIPAVRPAAIWVSLLFHAGLLEYTGSTFTMFFYVMEAAMLAFVYWPKERPVVIYDGDCGICNRIRRALQRVDFDGLFDWQPFQSGIGDRWGIPVARLREKIHLVYDGRIVSGFRACKLLLLYNPVTHLTLCALIAPFDSPLWRRLVAGLALAFFFPLFNPIGEWVYMLVARNRHRIGPNPTCDAEPQGLAKQ